MAKKVLVELIDDYDGHSIAAETVEFSLDGVEYVIDLSAANADQLRQFLADFVKHARKTRAGRRAKAGSVRGSDRERVNRIREWARSNGIDVSSRGRLAASVVAAYDAAKISQ
ncbi:Lsr2 family protein [Nocardia sp. NPDC046763]|uniref:histone-like nucleoid-structuring protein Lsr2 n=1 Tax=Nocardia sp. NPDC046763 TaxID=3155256 RepID=UPI0033CF3000